MATNLETVWEALFAWLRAETTSFKSFARRSKQWGLEQLPALELYDNGDETPTDEDGLPPLWKAAGEIVIVAKIEDADEAPTAHLNDLIHEVREALERKATDAAASGATGPSATQHWTNLGIDGLSLSVGRVEKRSLGEQTGLAVAIIAIEIATY